MKNIYFLPAWGQSSTEMLETLKLQTPAQSGKWKSIAATTKLFEADVFILQDYTTPEMESFLKLNDLWEQTYYFSREVPGAGPIQEYSQVKSFSYLKESSYLYTKWAYPDENNGGVSISYDSFAQEEPIEKIYYALNQLKEFSRAIDSVFHLLKIFAPKHHKVWTYTEASHKMHHLGVFQINFK